MLTSNGIVHYDTADGPWVTVWVDQQLADYCHSLIPKYHRVCRPRWKAHVTVVRPEDFPVNPDLQHWGKHEGEKVNFVYDPTVLYEKGFWWFNLWCVTMEDIRKELGVVYCKPHYYSPTGIFKMLSLHRWKKCGDSVNFCLLTNIYWSQARASCEGGLLKLTTL